MEKYMYLYQRRRCVAVLAILGLLEEPPSKRGKTRRWIKRREEKGYFNNIVRELMLEDTARYKEMMRMNHHDFQKILSLIEPDITPQQILGGQKVISAAQRLVLTIRFLATGESYRSLSFQFRISRAAISYIIKEVLDAIIKNLGPTYLRVPSSIEEWLAIAAKFEERWQYPNCIGAVDGKHIVIQPPPNAGSYFYNYKHTNSIVLMAVAGPDYECIYADVGTNGRVSDGGVWNKCGLVKEIEDKTISLPPPKCLPYGVEEMPYVFVGDDAFALSTHMMKPFAQRGLTTEQRIYNYRHSRARRLSENLFGIMANRWRVFLSVLSLQPMVVEALVMSALILHNFLRKSSSKSIYCPHGISDNETSSGDITPGYWRQDSPARSLLALPVVPRGHNSTKNAKQVREEFKNYFCVEGAIDWQWNVC